MNRSDSAKVREMTRRVLRVWDAASAEDLSNGLEWYSRARDVADSLAAGAPITTEVAAGVIAALSPRCGWSANVRGAGLMVDAFAHGRGMPVTAGTLTNRRKAWEILQRGGDPLEVLGGPKVRAFYANIMGDTHAVTVDVWAARVAEGPTFRDAAPAGKRYKLIATAYRRAGELLGVSARDVQAAVWTHYRRVNARALFD
jgi:hypothetical protein